MKTYLIEPCCAKRHLLEVRDAIAKGGEAVIEGFGDLSLSELLPAILTRYSEADMVIAAPSLPDQAAETVSTWMQRQWSRSDGKGKLDAIRHLTIAADMSARKSPSAHRWMGSNPFDGRMTLVDARQDETVILLPDFAVVGPVNMCYGRHFTARATTVAGDIAALWDRYRRLPDSVQASVGAQEDSPAQEDAGHDAPVAAPSRWRPVRGGARKG